MSERPRFGTLARHIRAHRLFTADYTEMPPTFVLIPVIAGCAGLTWALALLPLFVAMISIRWWHEPEGLEPWEDLLVVFAVLLPIATLPLLAAEIAAWGSGGGETPVATPVEMALGVAGTLAAFGGALALAGRRS